MSDFDADEYAKSLEKGREVARASRHEGLNNDTLRELLPMLDDGEIRLLGNTIENAIESRVKEVLLDRERDWDE